VVVARLVHVEHTVAAVRQVADLDRTRRVGHAAASAATATTRRATAARHFAFGRGRSGATGRRSEPTYEQYESNKAKSD
jgi:hypothetical protein